jgi:hypothetical protein
MFFINSIVKLVETIYTYAEKELYDEETLKRKLMELHVYYELGEIDDLEYDKLEEKLLEQLRIARDYNIEKNKELEGEDDYNEDDDQI